MAGPGADPALLQELGFSELEIDFGGHYRLNKTTLSMDADWHMAVKDLQSMEMSVEMSDVDTQTLGQGAPPQMNLAGFRVAVDVSPTFGKAALKHCAAGSELTVDEWSTRYAEQFIADIVAYCEKNGLYLIMDDIYHRLLFDGRKPINCYNYAKDLSENSKLIVVNGVSKQYAMTGFRIGWSVANPSLIEVMTNIQSHETSGPSALSQTIEIVGPCSDQAQ